MDALTETERRTSEKFERQESAKRTFAATAECVALCEELAPRLAEVIADKLKGRKALARELRPLGPHVLAIAGLAAALESIVIERGEPEATIAIGRAIQGELWVRGQPRKTRARIIKEANPKQAIRAAGHNLKDWSRRHRAEVGNLIKGALLDALPNVFALRDPVETLMEERYNAARAGKTLKKRKPSVPHELCITTAGEARAMALRDRLRLMNPSFVPCTEPPKPWTGWRDGGYWDERTRVSTTFVRNCHHPADIARIKIAFRDGSMKAHVDGVNALQSVAWKINVPVLEELKRRLPSFERKYRWHRVDDNYWRRFKVPMVKVGRKWVSETLLLDDIATAESLVGKKFYTPLNIDKRGRIFGVCNFNYGRQDYVRSLFMFADGLPVFSDPGRVEESGLHWLFVHAANCWGEDKVSFLNRFDWAANNYETLIEPVAKGRSDRWLEADQPFQFLAACIELVAAQEAQERNEPYVTHLPIGFDCSCSGLQHLCAMTRSEEGERVNLAPSRTDAIGEFERGQPQDIYRDVAEKVAERVTPGGKSLGIDRKLLKLPTSTFAYNVSDHGVNEQIREVIEERHDLDFSPPVEADLLCFPGRVLLALWLAIIKPARMELWKFASEVVRPAIEDTVRRPAKAMEWCRACAADRVIEWRTPSGLPWANRYLEPNKLRVLLYTQGRIWKPTIAEGFTTKIRRGKTKNSAAANLVHALDAAHLVRTVSACIPAGIRTIAAIHDTFACLAPQAFNFHQIIRQEFLRMYTEHDPLSELREIVSRAAPDIPALPEYGNFDLSQVLGAAYFAA
jgi:DNA-directed RNA polymerase